MTQQRQDLYTLIHKAIRARLFETVRRLGATDFVLDPAGPETLAFLRGTLGMLREHAAHEDRHIVPLIAACAPEVACQLGADHSRDEAVLAALEHLANDVGAAPTAQRTALGGQLYRATLDFVIDSLRHMRDEETRGNPALWAHYSDAELALARARLQADIPPARFAEWLVVMLPAMNLGERVAMLGAIRAGAPAAAWTSVRRVAASVLGEPGWAEVERALPALAA